MELINAHRANDNKMTCEMLDDMRTDDRETQEITDRLEVNLKKRFAKAGVDPYQATRWAIWDTFQWDILKPALYCYFSELSAICQNSMLILMINYITDESTEYYYGIAYVAVFAILMAVTSLLRQQYIFHGYNMSINIRKSLTGALYNKIERLTIKSLTETDSGKVISIISGDL